MVNNIAQEDQEGGPNGKGQKYSRVYMYMCTCGYMFTLSLSLSLFSFRVKNERSDGRRARVENRRTINRKKEKEGRKGEEGERERGVSLVQELPSQSAIEQFSLLWG